MGQGKPAQMPQMPAGAGWATPFFLPGKGNFGVEEEGQGGQLPKPLSRAGDRIRPSQKQVVVVCGVKVGVVGSRRNFLEGHKHIITNFPVAR